MCIYCVYLYLWPCIYSIVLSFDVPHILCQMWFERINELSRKSENKEMFGESNKRLSERKETEQKIDLLKMIINNITFMDSVLVH